MADQSWSDIGNSISELVQDAINSEDFSKLSQAIQNTISSTVNNAVSGAVNGTVNGVAQGMNAVGDSINRAAESMAKRQKTVQPPQNPWKGNGKFEKKTSDYLRAKDIPKNELYSPGGSTRAGGYLLSVIGGIGCFGFGMGLLVLGLISQTTGVTLALPMGILAPLLACSIYVTVRGVSVLGRFRRFKNYGKVLGNRTCITIRELASGAGKSEKFTLKDVRRMIDKDMFRQGHLDPKGHSLFVTHDGYEAYLKSQQQIEEKKNMPISRKQEEKSPAAGKGLPEDVKKLMDDGSHYIEQIRKSNEAIQDEAVSAKLDGLETVVSRIIEYVGQHPESAPETKKLMKYYLPTTIKLLESYQKLSDQPVQGENIRKSQKEIEDALDTLNQAFARLFDNLYRDTSVDITADISVLNTLLAQEGLTGEMIK